MLDALKEEIKDKWPQSTRNIGNYYRAKGYLGHLDDEVPIARAYGIASIFRGHKKHVYDNDIIVGSFRGLIDEDITLLEEDNAIVASYGLRTFATNADHYGPDYESFLHDGIEGTLEKIEKSKTMHAGKEELVFLEGVKITIEAFSDMIKEYGRASSNKEIYDRCMKISFSKPETFLEALQLVWFVHVAFYYEGRYAMALGRLDQYLYPFYKDISKEEVIEALANCFYKIGEARYFGGDDVVNIAIGGVKRDGTCAVNELSYAILEAVKRCNIPGPNLSARIHKDIPNDFLDASLEVIGTGLGYPALMNDEINIPALYKHGYSLEDARDYCMVGCIENFIQGKQPPWTDGRFNSPKYLEYALNQGVCMFTGKQLGLATESLDSFKSMDDFLEAFRRQLDFGASIYARTFKNENERLNRYNYMEPFLSAFAYPCIERAKDINDGGCLYPSVHGACCVGIASIANSLAAIEKNVFDEKNMTFMELREALLHNFEGYEQIHTRLLASPKYGNDDDYVDKYAIWFVDAHEEVFKKHKTYDGGSFYTAIASNVSNIPAGAQVFASPDGRKKGMPLSDAASPMHGTDRCGPSFSLNSLAKPDYKKVACGTVVNQKYSRNIFTDENKRRKLLHLIKVYFAKGGQQIQINSVSRETLIDAMDHPEKYRDLVVRVSGFSAYYNSLSQEVKLDILKRTEHG